ncbi:uncharacterized protein LOC121395112 [Xenopus laevis]|uniref:Uncharacterized protein LOC121395112 n=1 Tax=Xenopus laevis TaxID=8355 RepID=A0A8J1L268_XENLA|nr:uncharacterized protein LOC121395112 [Xenopus laevis]
MDVPLGLRVSSVLASFASDVVDTFVKIKKPGQRDDDDDEDYKEADEQSSEAEQPEEIEIGKLDTGIVKNEVLYIAVISILGVVAGLIAIGWILHCIFARKKKAYDEEKPPPPDFIQKHKDYWDTVMQWAKKAPIHKLKEVIVVKDEIPINKPKISEIPEEKKTKAGETKISQKSDKVFSKEMKKVELQEVPLSSMEIPQEKKETTARKLKKFHKTKTKKISPKLQEHKKEHIKSKELEKVELQEVPKSSIEIQRELQTMDQVSPVKESTPQIIKKVSEFRGKPEKVSVPGEPIFKSKRIRCYMWNEDLPSGVQQPDATLRPIFPGKVTPITNKDR